MPEDNRKNTPAPDRVHHASAAAANAVYEQLALLGTDARQYWTPQDALNHAMLTTILLQTTAVDKGHVALGAPQTLSQSTETSAMSAVKRALEDQPYSVMDNAASVMTANELTKRQRHAVFYGPQDKTKDDQPSHSKTLPERFSDGQIEG